VYVSTLPDGYKPFQFLRFSSNRLEHVQVPIELSGHPVILVGAGGEYPRVWLKIPTPGDMNQWCDVVVDNKVAREHVPGANLAPVHVESTKDPVPTIEVWIGRLPLLRARKEDKHSGVLEFIDLRPVGLNIVGSTSTLRIGGATFSNSSFRNVHTMVSSSSA
jgi:hypothetical protein